LTAISCGKGDSGLGRHLINDLSHTASFVGAGKILKNNYRLGVNRVVRSAGQVEVINVGGDVANAIGDEPDTHPGAFKVELTGRVIELVDLIHAMVIATLIERGAERS